jgi:hypothetical protein
MKTGSGGDDLRFPAAVLACVPVDRCANAVQALSSISRAYYCVVPILATPVWFCQNNGGTALGGTPSDGGYACGWAVLAAPRAFSMCLLPLCSAPFAVFCTAPRTAILPARTVRLIPGALDTCKAGFSVRTNERLARRWLLAWRTALGSAAATSAATACLRLLLPSPYVALSCRCIFSSYPWRLAAALLADETAAKTAGTLFSALCYFAASPCHSYSPFLVLFISPAASLAVWRALSAVQRGGLRTGAWFCPLKALCPAGGL